MSRQKLLKPICALGMMWGAALVSPLTHAAPELKKLNKQSADVAITKELKQTFNLNSVYYPSEIKVRSRQDIVFLSGKVDSVVQKIRAEEDASAIPGVRYVDTTHVKQPKVSYSPEDIAKTYEVIAKIMRLKAKGNIYNVVVDTHGKDLYLMADVTSVAQKNSLYSMLKKSFPQSYLHADIRLKDET